ncbi:MAG: O-antigen ligase family protein [Bryobacteraceae bacterium]|nr:O-antigen ligase family protein [Bryobacteraceae bacterium]
MGAAGWLLIAYLAAITVIGKGPTYLGVPPVFLGEVVLLTSLAFLVDWKRDALGLTDRLAPVSTLVILWFSVGLALTLANLQQYGLEAVRDGAIWYYSAFYFVGLSVGRSGRLADRYWRLFTYIWLAALVWGTAEYASGRRLSELGPEIPWRGVPIFFNARDEVGQNLALGALLVLLSSVYGSPWWRWPMRLLAIAGLALLAASEGRAVKLGLVAAFITIAAFAAAPRSLRLGRRALVMVAAAIPVALLCVLLVPDVAAKMQLDRFTEAAPSAAEGTAYWRLLWWQRLADEVFARNPLFGLGFGESLHYYHPALEKLNGDWMLRAPHNFNVTVLARMGLVGSFLWVAILALGIGTLVVRAWRGRNHRFHISPQRREELAFWAAMLLYCFVNSSFGVLMEGPVLGVWFWFALGFSLGRSNGFDDLLRSRLSTEIRKRFSSNTVVPSFSR